MGEDSSQDALVVAGLRRILVFAYLVGGPGLTMELWLLEHTEGIWQLLPIMVLGISVLVLVLVLWVRRRWALRLFQLLTLGILLTSVVGVYLHFDGKAEFKLEIDPELSGWDLIWECIHGHSLPPVFAPGAMVLLALVGVAYFYKHPLLTNSKT